MCPHMWSRSKLGFRVVDAVKVPISRRNIVVRGMSAAVLATSLHGAHAYAANQASKNESRWQELLFQPKKVESGAVRCAAVVITISFNVALLAMAKVHTRSIAACSLPRLTCDRI
jgi:hypothetical protein